MYYNGKLEKIIYVRTGDGVDSFLCPRMAGITRPNPRYHIDYSRHEEIRRHFVFEYVRQGRGWIREGDQMLTVGAGDFYFYHKNAVLSYGADPEQPYEKLWLNVAGSFVEGLCTTYGMTEGVLVRHVNVEPQMMRIHALLAHTTAATSARDMHALALLLHELIAEVMQERFAGQDERATAEVSIALRLRGILEEKLYTPFTLDDLSKLVYLSKTHIIRVFRTAYHVTPMRYLLERRMDTAKALLSGSQMAVGEIAALLQFGDSQHFSHCFRRETGVTPSEFRQKMQGK